MRLHLPNISASFKTGSRYRALFLSLILSAIGYGLYKGVIDNYMAEVVRMNEMDRGLTEFFRELPGLLLILILAICYKATAEKVYKAGMAVMFIGMVLQGVISPEKWCVILVIFLYSTGEHIQLGMRNTLTLEYSAPKRGGRALGYQNSVLQIGNLIGFIAVSIAFAFIGSTKMFTPTFLIAAALMGFSLLASLRLTGNSHSDSTKSRFYFRKKFRKYYLLEVFYGARKQVFFTFGPYVLILFYGADAGVISLLFAVSAIAGFIFSPLIGRLIDKLGYRTIMIADTIILVGVCVMYGFAHHIFPMHIAFIICCINYIFDAVISLASMASGVYVQHISDSQEELRATLSTGISVNHLITIFVALLGGWIWKVLGIETLFTISAILGLINSAYAASIPPPKQE